MFNFSYFGLFWLKILLLGSKIRFFKDDFFITKKHRNSYRIMVEFNKIIYLSMIHMFFFKYRELFT